MKVWIKRYIEAKKEAKKMGTFDIEPIKENDYSQFYIWIKPNKGVYKDQYQILKMTLKYDNKCYPINPPRLIFLTNIYHTNVHEGSICVDFLKSQNAWSPENSFVSIINNMLILYKEQNIADPYDSKATKTWDMCLKLYKSRINDTMSLKQRELIEKDCFKSFKYKADEVAKSNNIEVFSLWFPILDKKNISSIAFDDGKLTLLAATPINDEPVEINKIIKLLKIDNKSNEKTDEKSSEKPKKKKRRWKRNK